MEVSQDREDWCKLVVVSICALIHNHPTRERDRDRQTEINALLTQINVLLLVIVL